MALRKCPECGKEISTSATKCPNCGYKDKATQIIYLILIFLVVGIIVGIGWYYGYQKHLEDLSNRVNNHSINR